MPVRTRNSTITRAMMILEWLGQRYRGRTTEDIIEYVELEIGDPCCHRTVRRDLQTLESLGFVERQMESSRIGTPITWIALYKLEPMDEPYSCSCRMLAD